MYLGIIWKITPKYPFTPIDSYKETWTATLGLLRPVGPYT